MSLLDGPARLSEVFEPSLLEELCRDWVAVYGVSLRVFDASGQLAEVVRDDGLASQILATPSTRHAFASFVTQLKNTPLEPHDTLIRDDPALGARYMVLPVAYEYDVLGRIVCGPYLRPGLSAPPGPDLSAVPRLDDVQVQTHLRLLLKSVGLVCHAGYRALLTSAMHLRSITRAHDDLQVANHRLEQANARLKASNERLRELDQLKSDFLATVSHELRTPLTSVIGYSEMLREGLAGPVNSEQHEYLSTILERSESLLKLIEGVLSFSRNERSPARWVSVDVAELVTTALTAVRPQAAKGGLVIEVAIEPDLPRISVDRERMVQLLINLLGNAVKFTSEGGLVRVAAGRASRGGAPVIRFVVSDTGIGIPSAAHDRIFEPFYQVDGSSTREYGGTGLGLSIVKSFVEAHGGEVSVDSAVGVGTTFTVDIPFTQQVDR